MKRWLVLGALVAVFAAQWAIPTVSIHRHQTVIEQGTAYRFRTLPVDPVDPFRGRYVALRFAAADIDVPEDARYPSDADWYAAIATNSAGFATLAAPQPEPPAGDYLEVSIAGRPAPDRLHVELPFDRYYMDETMAPEAERLAREAVRANAETALAPSWATVRVLDGRAVLTALYIDGVAVHERIKQARQATASE